MSKIYLKIPQKEDLNYRQKWLNDEQTMFYNAGYDLKIKGYNYDTGIINKNSEELEKWYHEWIGKEPEKYFAYIIEENTNIPIGEVYFYYEKIEQIYKMGILIESKHRRKGYGCEALKELQKVAFEIYKIKELSDTIPEDRISTIRTFEKVGFIKTDNVKKTTKFGKEIQLVQLILTKSMYKKLNKYTIKHTNN